MIADHAPIGWMSLSGQRPFLLSVGISSYAGFLLARTFEN